MGWDEQNKQKRAVSAKDDGAGANERGIRKGQRKAMRHLSTETGKLTMRASALCRELAMQQQTHNVASNAQDGDGRATYTSERAAGFLTHYRRQSTQCKSWRCIHINVCCLQAFVIRSSAPDPKGYGICRQFPVAKTTLKIRENMCAPVPGAARTSHAAGDAAPTPRIF